MIPTELEGWVEDGNRVGVRLQQAGEGSHTRIVMADLTLTWLRPFAGTPTEYHDRIHGALNWIYEVTWASGRTAMSDDRGLYVIENPAGQQVYAGVADDGWETRFGGRSEAFREFRLSTSADNPVHGYKVYLTSVYPWHSKRLLLAEKWLIRTLRKAQDRSGTLVLQNIDSGKTFKAPIDGLTVTNSGTRPSFVAASYSYKPEEKI
jgi:hypothetical protein